jgi:hypothetical protein
MITRSQETPAVMTTGETSHTSFTQVQDISKIICQFGLLGLDMAFPHHQLTMNNSILLTTKMF